MIKKELDSIKRAVFKGSRSIYSPIVLKYSKKDHKRGYITLKEKV